MESGVLTCSLEFGLGSPDVVSGFKVEYGLGVCPDFESNPEFGLEVLSLDLGV